MGPYPTGIQGNSLWGPAFDDDEIEIFLKTTGVPYKKMGPEELVEATAQELAREKVVGWFQGRMEFGPRALGARSILGDPRSSKMQSVMNLKIKFRESFRPFAPSVLKEKAADYFDLDTESPYMLMVADVRESKRVPENHSGNDRAEGLEKLNRIRSVIPAVTHVDYSARIQTVSQETMPLYYRLIQAFERLTECPVLINTSFNVRGEPIVCTPAEAYKCFAKTKMDTLVMGAFILSKDNATTLSVEKEYSGRELAGAD
jgi:carbamoyltransferase